jgi:hypothetical protein
MKNLLYSAAHQKFFLADRGLWIAAEHITVGMQLQSIDGDLLSVTKCIVLNDEEVVYEITVNTTHTYYVSKHGILVHNPIPVVVGIAFVFGGGAIEFAGVSVSIGVLGAWLSAKLWGEKSKHAKVASDNQPHPSQSIGNCVPEIGLFGRLEGPLQEVAHQLTRNAIADLNDFLEKEAQGTTLTAEKEKPQSTKTPDNKPKKDKDSKNSKNTKPVRNPTNQPNPKKEERDKKRAETQKITNKEAESIANDLGYTRDNNPPFKNKEVVYKKGKSWISPDIDRHKGGFWKEFDRRGHRNATWDKYMKKIIDN